MKKVYQNIRVSPVDLENGKVEIINKSFFTNASEFETKWELFENGKPIANGVISVDIPAQLSKIVDIPYELKPDAKSEYFLNVSFHTKETKNSIPKGHELAFEQLLLKKTEALEFNYSSTNDLKITDVENELIVEGDSFTIQFNRKTGNLSNVTYEGIPCIIDELQPDFWRVPTDNDYGCSC